jgi:hypothetical protein
VKDDISRLFPSKTDTREIPFIFFVAKERELIRTGCCARILQSDAQARESAFRNGEMDVSRIYACFDVDVSLAAVGQYMKTPLKIRIDFSLLR